MQPDADRDDAPFSEEERQALAAWAAPQPPADFAARALDRARADAAERRRSARARALVAGGLLALALAGFVASRLRRPQDETPAVASEPSTVPDAAPRAEASQAADGVNLKS